MSVIIVKKFDDNSLKDGQTNGGFTVKSARHIDVSVDDGTKVKILGSFSKIKLSYYNYFTSSTGYSNETYTAYIDENGSTKHTYYYKGSTVYKLMTSGSTGTGIYVWKEGGKLEKTWGSSSSSS